MGIELVALLDETGLDDDSFVLLRQLTFLTYVLFGTYVTHQTSTSI